MSESLVMAILNFHLIYELLALRPASNTTMTESRLLFTEAVTLNTHGHAYISGLVCYLSFPNTSC